MKQPKRWREVLIGTAILAAATFVIAALCGLICAVFMLPLGFQYDGLWDIVVFFFWGSVLAIPFSLLAEALPGALYSLGKLPLWAARALYLLLDAAATALGLAAVDQLMASIQASGLALWVAGLLLALPGLKDIGKEKR